MNCLIIIKHWDNESEPRKELRLYDMNGNALGFGELKISDTKQKPGGEPNLFSGLVTEERAITYQVSLDLKKLGKYLDNGSD